MSDLNSICYKNTFLNEVIIRLDFLAMLPEESLFEQGLVRTILLNYPHQGKQQLIRFGELQLPNDLGENETPQFQNKIYNGIQIEYTDDFSNKIFVSSKSIAFEFKKYDSFEKMMEIIVPIVGQLFLKNKINVTRTGIRYINIFESGKVFKSYFNSQIASVLDSRNVEDSFKCKRSMHLTEFFDNGLNINFRYGLFNPEYPKNMLDKSFVLDYDSFTNDLFSSYDGIIGFINEGHDAIQTLFEESITDKLRGIMRNEWL